MSLALAGGCRSNDPDFTPYMARLYLEESPNLPASHITEMVLPLSGSHVTVRSKPVFGEWDIMRAMHFESEFGPAIVLLFTADARADFYRTTISNQGRRLILTINGLPVGGHYISGPIEDGRIAFYLEMDDEDIPAVAEGIQKTSNEIQKRAQSSRW